MSDLEPLLRRTMAEHADEAPDGDDDATVSRLRGRRRGRLAAITTVVAVLALAAGAAALWPSSSGRTASPPAHRPSSSAQSSPPDHPSSSGQTSAPPTGIAVLHCPERYPDAVPWAPRGVSASGRLVPLKVPERAVVCGYLGAGRGWRGNHTPLSGSRVLTGDLAAIPDELAYLPPPSTIISCPHDLLVTDLDNYLLGLSYDGGTVWVAIPGDHCSGASNGPVAATNLRADAARAYRSGAWSLPRAPEPCSGEGGRIGQEVDVVPPTPTSLTLCVVPSHGSRGSVTRRDFDTGFERLVDLLNAGTRRTHLHRCHGDWLNIRYRLTFHYAEGPPVGVQVTVNCSPGVSNGSLYVDTGDVIAAIKQLLAR